MNISHLKNTRSSPLVCASDSKGNENLLKKSFDPVNSHVNQTWIYDITHSVVFSRSLFNVLREIRVGRGSWGKGEQGQTYSKNFFFFFFLHSCLKELHLRTGWEGSSALWQRCHPVNTTDKIFSPLLPYCIELLMSPGKSAAKSWRFGETLACLFRRGSGGQEVGCAETGGPRSSLFLTVPGVQQWGLSWPGLLHWLRYLCFWTYPATSWRLSRLCLRGSELNEASVVK